MTQSEHDTLIALAHLRERYVGLVVNDEAARSLARKGLAVQERPYWWRLTKRGYRAAMVAREALGLVQQSSSDDP